MSAAEPGSETSTIDLPTATKRLVVLGDPHGDTLALSLVLRKEERPGVAIVSAGDNVGYADARASSELCRMLETRGVRSVFGNHEEWSGDGRLFLSPPGEPRQLTDEALAWCRALPYRLRITAGAAPGLVLHVVHSFRDWSYVDEASADLLAEQEGADVVFVGHTHSPAIYAIAGPPAPFVSVNRLNPRSNSLVVVAMAPGTRYVVDAGSLARPDAENRRHCLDRLTYAAIDLETRTLALHALDKRRALEALLRREVDENTRAARDRARIARPDADRPTTPG